MIPALLISMRPRQWIKNGFVLVAPLFDRRLHDMDTALLALSALGLFCVAASSIYLLNDVADRERDRAHPRKRKRPVASGALPVPIALGASAVFGALALAGGFLLAPGYGWLLAVYLAIQFCYCLWLRHVVLLDVFCIASGFVIRVLAGAYATSISPSSWLVLTTIFISLFLALCKRRAEFVSLSEDVGEGHRKTLAEYDEQFLDQLISVATASVVICYALYTLAEETQEQHQTDKLVFTVPLVVYGIYRYLFLVHRRREGGSPASAVLSDLPLFVNGLLWAAATLTIIYHVW